MDIITNIYIKSVGMCCLPAKHRKFQALYGTKSYINVQKCKDHLVKLFYTKYYLFYFLLRSSTPSTALYNDTQIPVPDVGSLPQMQGILMLELTQWGINGSHPV